MSRHTSLQRADQKSPACHHLFPAVEIHSKPEAGILQKSSTVKNRFSAGSVPSCQIKFLNKAVD